MADKERFTLKQFLPFLNEDERKLLGLKLVKLYRITHGKDPVKIQEDGLIVCSYTSKFFKRASKKITI